MARCPPPPCAGYPRRYPRDRTRPCPRSLLHGAPVPTPRSRGWQPEGFRRWSRAFGRMGGCTLTTPLALVRPILSIREYPEAQRSPLHQIGAVVDTRQIPSPPKPARPPSPPQCGHSRPSRAVPLRPSSSPRAGRFYSWDLS